MRLLTDNEIVEIIGQGILHEADEEKVLSIGYDLKPRAYYNMNKEGWDRGRFSVPL